MYKNGFRFEVVANGIIGEIDGVTAPGIYSICFYENGQLYLRADVHESTITNNLKIGAYKEIESRGKWILQPSNKIQDKRDLMLWKCSECGQIIYSETEQDKREFHAYCGRCGAKMVVEE